ncbi:hypothetical protein AaE_013703 [Aphanomyces astaci]|uniref:Glutathionylspermidine synthase pre-ATP-grasp-like domain-containing protein n=1 Tax=Aphanomyces astaci TaxID=112090 RepID=A0A6A4Z9G8_APHAT|nr:hypothetical protein AaE_013703 [Aphanomyces astaci]
MAISASSVLPKYLNAVKKDLAVHTLNIARHVGNARYLDASLPFVPTFEAKYGHQVSTAQQSKYYTITEAGQAGVEAATDILHQLFLRATDHVLAHKRELAPYFCIPAGLWPKIQHSWTHQYVRVIHAFDRQAWVYNMHVLANKTRFRDGWTLP